PLSLQAHPDAARAAVAFDAAHPGYTDRYHKPELLVAVDEFEALCGFRSPASSADVLAALRVPALRPVVEALCAPTTEENRLASGGRLPLSAPGHRARSAARGGGARGGAARRRPRPPVPG